MYVTMYVYPGLVVPSKRSGGNIGYHSIWAASGDNRIKSIDPLATKRESSLGGQMCRNPPTKNIRKNNDRSWE